MNRTISILRSTMAGLQSAPLRQDARTWCASYAAISRSRLDTTNGSNGVGQRAVGCTGRRHSGDVHVPLTREQVSALPDFACREYTTPPPTWTVAVSAFSGPTLMPGRQRERLGPAQVEPLRDTRVTAARVWTRGSRRSGPANWKTDGLLDPPRRSVQARHPDPVEWLNYAADERELRLSGSLADVT